MRFKVVTCAAMMGATAAVAGWKSFTLNGTGNDVNVEDVGVVTFATTLEAAVKTCQPDGGCQDVRMPLVGSQTTAIWQLDGGAGGGCLLGGAANITSLRGCSTNMFAVATGVRRLRHSTSGFTAVHYVNAPGATRFAWAASPSAASYATYAPVGGGAGNNNALSVYSLGGFDYTALDSSGSNVYFSVDGGGVAAISVLPTMTIGDLQLFGRADGGLGLLVTEKASVPRIAIGGIGGDAVWLPASAWNPNSAFLGSVAYTELGGSVHGNGFGMGLGVDGGLVSPIPNPAQPGMTWVERSPPALLSVVSCWDPSFCAAVTNGNATAWLYWNESPPSGSLPALSPQTLGVPFTITALSVTDPDEDPVWVSWEPDDAGVFSIATSYDGGLGTTAQVTPLSCGTGQLVAWLSDGYGAHDTRLSTPLTVTGVPAQPTINATAMTVAAGGSSIGLTAVPGDGGCPGTGYAWSQLSGPGSVMPPSGTTATYSPPQTLCLPSGADAVIAVSATGTPDASVPATVTIHVDPWGAPLSPTFNVASATQTAGFDASYPLVGTRHACVNAPVVTTWAVDGGVTGVTWRVDDAGIDVFSTDVCASGRVTASAQYTVGTQSAPPTQLDIDIVPYQTAPTGFTTGWVFSNGCAQGTYAITGAGCTFGRGFSAGITVTDQFSGAVVASSPTQLLDTDAGWQLCIPNSCNGGAYTAVGRLLGTGLSDSKNEGIGRVDAGLLAFDTDLDVACGGGVSGAVGVSLPPEDCQAVSITWEQISGPPLLAEPRDTLQIHIATQDNGFDGLVGETITWRITAVAGVGNQASAELSVHLRHKFIALEHAMGPQAAGADDLHTVRVRVSDVEPCGASAITVHEVLDGLTPIAGSARIDGVAVDAGVVDGLFVVGPFPIEGLQARELTYLARAPMFGRPSPTGIAKVKDEVVSIDAQLQPPPQRPACGCASGGSSLLALLLLSSCPTLRALSRRRTSGRSGPRSRPS